MQHIPNGPQIPDELLFAHQEGRVVFFCGSGISIPAGLPNFKELIDQLYKRLNTDKTQTEEKFYNNEQFDIVLESLEKRKSRTLIRKKIREILTPKKKEITNTIHHSLLQLSEYSDRVFKIITTNLDRIFEYTAKKHKIKINSYVAPLIPFPKDDYWNGIVYLHGLLQNNRNDESSLNKLILSSSDFGLAYLTERWASKFVTELFRRYVVCFVGYSANDTILRYMLDAIAADNQFSEKNLSVYAFAGFEEGKEDVVAEEWKSRKIIPILYNSKDNHSLLYTTFKKWAETYTENIDGKKKIVRDISNCSPLSSTQEDDIVGRMLWALSDKSGDIAEYFSKMKPTPSLDWLTAFSKISYDSRLLELFGVPYKNTDRDVEFSIVRRPTHPIESTWMSLVSKGQSYCPFDKIMNNLAIWLTKHLNDPELILWIVEQGGILHPTFSKLIEDKIEEIHNLDESNRQEILTYSPNAIPSKYMEKLWLLIIGGYVKNSRSHFDFYYWKDCYKKYGLNFLTLKKLSEILTPKIVIKRHINIWNDTQDDRKLDVEVELSADYIRDASKELKVIPELSSLLELFQTKLIDALKLWEEVEYANSKFDGSYWSLPSIEPHSQNSKHYGDWVVLIELLRDSWLDLLSKDEGKAVSTAKGWFNINYPTFKRLALFATTKTNLIPSKTWIDCLLNDNAFFLWTASTKREVMRLIFHKGKNIPKNDKNKLERTILLGPSRDSFRNDIKKDDLSRIIDRSKWLLLAKLRLSGATLGLKAQKKLEELENHYPQWRLSKNEKEEFPSWLSGTGDPDWEEDIVMESVPFKFKLLIKFLRKKRDFNNSKYKNDWSSFCEKYPRRSFYALVTLGLESKNISLWLNEALYAWSRDSTLALQIWHYYLKYKKLIPLSVLNEHIHAASWWLEKLSSALNGFSDDFLSFCRNICSVEQKIKIRIDGNIADVLTDVINHPIGMINQALFNVWFNTKPKDNDKLPIELKNILIQFCDRKIKKFSYARIFLGKHLIPLYRVDKKWTETNVIPLFDWNNDDYCTKLMWIGFFARNQIDQSLMQKLKLEFSLLATNLSELGKWSNKFLDMLTFLAINKYPVYTKQEYLSIFRELSSSSYEYISGILEREIYHSSDKDYVFNKLIKPFWKSFWIIDKRDATPQMSLNLANIVVLLDSKFRDSFELFDNFLIPLEKASLLLYKIKDSNLSQEHPEILLKLLHKIINKKTNEIFWLKEILNNITTTLPTLKKRKSFKELNDIASNPYK